MLDYRRNSYKPGIRDYTKELQKRYSRKYGDREGYDPHKVGRLIKELILEEERLHLGSRMGWWATEFKSKHFYPSLETMQQTLNASDAQIGRALRWLVRKGLLKKCVGGYEHAIKRGENPDQYKLRVQATIQIEVGLIWILRDITNKAEVAPHTKGEFADQLKCHRTRVADKLQLVLDLGIFNRWVNRNGKTSYTRVVGDEAVNYNQKMKYGSTQEETIEMRQDANQDE